MTVLGAMCLAFASLLMFSRAFDPDASMKEATLAFAGGCCTIGAMLLLVLCAC